MNFKIKVLERDTLSEQLNVYRAAFNTMKDISEINDLWIKKHYENPLGDSLVFGAYHEGILVGMNAYMPVEYHYKGTTIPMLQSCESGVLPEFQGKGIWSKVVRCAIDYIFQNTKYQAIIGFPNYINSYPGFKKMGWDTLYEMSNYVIVNNPVSFSKTMFEGKRFFQLLVRLIALQRLGVCFTCCNCKNYSIDECQSDELLWDDNLDVLSVSHNKQLIEWKKSYKGIKTIAIKKGGDVLATCIYSLGDYNGASIIKLEKCVVGNCSLMSYKKAIALLCRYFAKEYRNVVFVRAWSMPNTHFSSALKKLFFMKSSHPNPFIIMQSKNRFMDFKWDLSFFDLD